MIVVGVAFLLFWCLAQVFKLDLLVSALVTAIVFIALGLLLGERLPRRQ